MFPEIVPWSGRMRLCMNISRTGEFLQRFPGNWKELQQAEYCLGISHLGKQGKGASANKMCKMPTSNVMK